MYLLDTCVFSELIKKKPIENVTNWILSNDEELFYVSALTFGEIKKVIEKITDSSRKEQLESWFQEFLISRFLHRLLSIDGPVANTWGQLIAKTEQKGRVLPTIDSLIAATAITHNLHIVTRNVKDFEALNIIIINPWKEV
ncbi:MAG: type II toxin-antitoxin system VapC family toxin [Parachlamydia sp.]|nr:type II toxin-antitoxin system VapC family toxin [Parachlamydia sp.]